MHFHSVSILVNFEPYVVGSPGPGETRIPRGFMLAISSTVFSSFLKTTCSHPKSPRYCRAAHNICHSEHSKTGQFHTLSDAGLLSRARCTASSAVHMKHTSCICEKRQHLMSNQGGFLQELPGHDLNVTLSGQMRVHLREVVRETVVVVYKHHRPLRFSIRCSKASESLGSEHMSSSLVSQTTLPCME